MTNNEKKAFLRAYREAQRALKRIDESIEALRSAQEGVSSPQFDDMPKAHNISDLSDYAAKLDALERRYRIQKENALRVLVDVQTAIDTLDDETYKTLLLYRYINGMTWEKLADALQFDLRWTYRLHRKAISALDL